MIKKSFPFISQYALNISIRIVLLQIIIKHHFYKDTEFV